jgi:hypothetical protein
LTRVFFILTIKLDHSTVRGEDFDGTRCRQSCWPRGRKESEMREPD